MAENEMKYGPSTVAELKVIRDSEFGVFLDAETGNSNDDILLHKTQQTAPVAVGDVVKVFLYLDPKRRLTASMRVPKMREGQVARLKVINVTRDGAFLDVGAERGIFLPYAGMRGRLAVTMKVEDELRRASRPAEGVKVGQMLNGSVYNITDTGAFVFTDERFIAFVPHKEMPERPRVGADVKIRVTFLRDDGRLNGSMREIKEKAISIDGEKILYLLQQHNGRMPYSDDSSPEMIKSKFKISKAAFKRALGHLMKDGLVEQRDGWTYLK